MDVCARDVIIPSRRFLGPFALTLAIFAVDVITPLGYVGYLFYVVPIWWACHLEARPKRRALLLLAALCSLLIVLGLLWSPPGVAPSVAASNRVGVSLLLFVTALMLADRKQAKRALASLSHHHQLLLDSAGEGIYGLDAHGKATFVNPAACRLLGWQAEDLAGRRMHEIHHHSRRDGTVYAPDECPVYAALRDGSVHQVDHELFWRKDGSSFPVEYVSTPIWEHGAVVGAVVVFKDITERKLAEEKAREREEEFRAMFTESSVGKVQADPTTGRFLRVNAAYCRLTGYSEAELLLRTVADVTHPDDRMADRELFDQMVRGKKPFYEAKKRYLRPDGATVWVHVTANLIRDASGRPVRTTAVIEDITEQKKAGERIRALLAEAEQRERELREKQEQLVQAAKMASLGELASGVAHELNNPLNNISLCLSNVLDRLRDNEVHPTIEESFTVAQREITKAATIINNLRTFARKALPVHERIIVNEVVRRAAELLYRQLRLASIQFECSYADDHLVVLGNALQLEQVIVNLVTNARDAVERAETKAISVWTARDDGQVVIAVQDTGEGIEPHIAPRIFDPFFTTKDVGKGTGLGLSISYRLVKDMGGSISVHSESGAGSRFMIQLPLATGFATGTDEHSSTEVQRPSLRV